MNESQSQWYLLFLFYNYGKEISTVLVNCVLFTRTSMYPVEVDLDKKRKCKKKVPVNLGIACI